ncbi:phage baseplate protein [Xenorhabdus griffiniae]|uniref:Dit-like phage tail protein N-terminal domain-containing protein n=1 Tax=Xenorhabdus griffiniae TaxID=351672 RepID=A0ABY9XE79_9GAMM|nr:hypothetical protein [Xenorhabdus griffiniae]MBD1228393.1 hypothetical protein [Xenorhabdus griffiniae]MBE8587954.1 hypothetical protein [Xenorhabdus griffiniae]WMV71226.1 hypothetical protein QL128_13660 [Xenorhabdus griffiniae]WNH00902.1 hypothetical protein QL112_013665 [Xenorhabdus griffiniae]
MDLLSGFNTTTASVITRSIGEFQFDCVVIENHNSNLRITENPIESGAAIADHAILEPKEITLVGIMVGYQPPQHFRELIGLDLSTIDRFPVPIEIRAMTRQAESMVNRYISTAESMMEQADRAIAPWLPKYQGRANDNSQTLDRIGKTYNDLLNLQKKGETITVQTGLKQYKNMMLVSIGVTQMNDGSAEFSLTLREIFIVETQTAQGLHPNLKKIAKKKKNMGKTQPKKVDEKSMLEWLFGGD